MNVQHIIINDSNPEHRELSIYRTGKINRVKLQDKTYTTYHSLEMDGHDYAAFFLLWNCRGLKQTAVSF